MCLLIFFIKNDTFIVIVTQGCYLPDFLGINQ